MSNASNDMMIMTTVVTDGDNDSNHNIGIHGREPLYTQDWSLETG